MVIENALRKNPREKAFWIMMASLQTQSCRDWGTCTGTFYTEHEHTDSMVGKLEHWFHVALQSLQVCHCKSLLSRKYVDLPLKVLMGNRL